MWPMGMNFWGLIIVSMTIGWVLTTWIRAKHGYPVEDSWGNAAHPGDRNGSSRLEADLAARDDKIRELEERVQVLERIVTDRAASVSEEIERLRA